MNEDIKKFDYEYKKINSSQIVKADYQRELKTAKVKKIVSNFNPNRVRPIEVSFRDGKYWVFDGQHTLRSLVSRNSGHDLLVDCKVYYGMTYEDEAKAFAEQSDLSSNVETAQKLYSLYLAKDEKVSDFKETVEKCGIICDFRKHGGDCRIVCYKSLFDIFCKQGKAHVERLLNIIIDAWDGEATSLHMEIILGMNIFITTYAGEYNRDTLIKKLKTVSPQFIIREANVASCGGNRRYARQILHIYNRNASKNHLEDKIG